MQESRLKQPDNLKFLVTVSDRAFAASVMSSVGRHWSRRVAYLRGVRVSGSLSRVYGTGCRASPSIFFSSFLFYLSDQRTHFGSVSLPSALHTTSASSVACSVQLFEPVFTLIPYIYAVIQYPFRDVRFLRALFLD